MSLWLYLIISLFLTLFSKALLPHFSLIPLAPLLSYLLIEHSIKRAFWAAFFGGVILDLLCWGGRFGCIPLCLAGAVFTLSPLRSLLFKDKMLSIPLFSALFSLTFTLFYGLVLWLFHNQTISSFSSFFSDLGLCFFLDGIAAFCFFTLPQLAIGRLNHLYSKHVRRIISHWRLSRAQSR